LGLASTGCFFTATAITKVVKVTTKNAKTNLMVRITFRHRKNKICRTKSIYLKCSPRLQLLDQSNYIMIGPASPAEVGAVPRSRLIIHQTNRSANLLRPDVVLPVLPGPLQKSPPQSIQDASSLAQEAGDISQSVPVHPPS